MFWNIKKKQKIKPQQKSSASKERKKETPPQWKPTYVKPINHQKQPIPKVELESKNRKDWGKEFIKTFHTLSYNHRTWDVWQDLIVMCACAISNSLDKENYECREKRYLETVNKYTKEEQKIFPELVACITMALEENPEQDFLGKLFMELNLSDKSRDQFFTPYHVCELMADVTVENALSEVQSKGYISVYDPCCGAGATLIASIHTIKKQLEKSTPPLNYQNYILVAAQDIDETVALMCYIQLSLLGVAGYVKVGNALTNPLSSNDPVDNYWFTPMYFSDIWYMRRTFQKFDNLFKRDS